MSMTVDNAEFAPIKDLNPELLRTVQGNCNLGQLEAVVDAARRFATNSRASATRTAYHSDWTAFSKWCQKMGFSPLPSSPEVVAIYAAHLVSLGRKVATISRTLVSISQAHKAAGHPSPTTGAQVTETMRGVRRSLGVAQVQKAPILAEQLRTLVQLIPDDLIGYRDRALLLLGFAMAARRSELIGLDVADLEFSADGLVVNIKRSKTDQEGQGRRLGVPYGSTPLTCPVRAVRAWLEMANIKDGPLFRAVGRWGHVQARRLEAKTVARVVQKCAGMIGLDPKVIGGHSLRSGLATSAARAGKSERSIMAQTGHRSVAMVRKYIRAGSLFVDNAASGLL